MKRISVIARVSLVTVNAVFGIYLCHGFLNMAKAHHQYTWLSTKTIEDSAALDTNALQEYVVLHDSTTHPDPVRYLKESAGVTVTMFRWLIAPTICLLWANVVLMVFFWKTGSGKQDAKSEP